jgi:hypothetical protein
MSNETAPRETQQVPWAFVVTGTGNVEERKNTLSSERINKHVFYLYAQHREPSPAHSTVLVKVEHRTFYEIPAQWVDRVFFRVSALQITYLKPLEGFGGTLGQ